MHWSISMHLKIYKRQGIIIVSAFSRENNNIGYDRMRLSVYIFMFVCELKVFVWWFFIHVMTVLQFILLVYVGHFCFYLYSSSLLATFLIHCIFSFICSFFICEKLIWIYIENIFSTNTHIWNWIELSVEKKNGIADAKSRGKSTQRISILHFSIKEIARMKYAIFYLSCGETSKNNAAAEIKIDLELDVCVYAFQNYNKPW